MEVNIHKYCRVCTRKNTEMKSIFEDYKFSECNLQIFEVITKCASVQIRQLDGFSERICKRCTENLCSAFSFKQLCEDSDYKFRHNLIDLHAHSAEASKIQRNENKINEELDNLSFVKSEIKNEIYEEDTFQYGVLQEGNIKKPSTNFTRLQNLNGLIASLEKSKPTNFPNEKSQMCEFNKNFDSNNEETKIYRTEFIEINDRNWRGNISSDFGMEIKSESQYDDEEASFTTSQNLNGELSVGLQKFEEDEHNTILIKQETVHSAETPFKCTTCGKCFKGRGKLNFHRKIHTSEKPYKCETCGKCFKDKFTLNKHNKIHTGVKPYKCEACDKSFTERNKLNIHKRIHTGEKPYKCEKCDKCFTWQSTLIKHNKMHMREKLHQCETCGKCFRQQQTLIFHKATHTEPYKCATCEATFANKTTLNIHKSVHAEEKPYKCETCSKCFTDSLALRRHEKIHSGEKPHKCEMCGKCFFGKGTLNIHMRLHTGENCLKCEVCDKCYTDRGKLNLHMRTHTGEKPYKCEICGKCFRLQVLLTEHGNIHTGEKPYECETCGKCFNRRTNLNRHKRTLHGRITL